MELIKKYFGSQFDEQQMEQFAALDALYRDWNSKINVISRKDIDMLYEHHVLRHRWRIPWHTTCNSIPEVPLHHD